MQKSLQDYQTIAKLLKLDILRVKVSTDALRSKLGQPEQSIASAESTTHNFSSRDLLANAYHAMQLFARELDRLALTPETFFRMADEHTKKCIEVSHFTGLLKKMKIQLPKEAVDQLCFRLDIKSNGTIELNHYRATAAAFQISTEPYPLNSNASYADSSLAKLAWLCKQQSADLSSIDTDKPMDFADFRRLVQKQVPAIEEIELAAIFLSFDKCRQFRIGTDAIYRRLAEEIKEVTAGRRQQPTDITSNQLNTKPKPKDTIKEEKSKQKPMQNAGSPKSTLSVEQILSQTDFNFQELFSRVLKAATESAGQTAPLHRSFVMSAVKDMLQKGCKKRALTSGQLFLLFRQIDTDENGSVSVLEICKFFQRYKRSKDNNDPLIETMAYMIEVAGTSVEAFMDKRGVTRDTKVSLSKFESVFEEFGWGQKEFEALYNEIRGTTALTGAKLIDVLKMHINTARSEKVIPSARTDPQAGALLKALSNIQSQLKNLPKPSSANYFQKKQLNIKASEWARWRTIFTSETEAMHFCYHTALESLAKQAEGRSDWRWKDSEFGGSPTDPHGMNSINGASKPMNFLPSESEIEWLRTVDYVNTRNEKLKQKLQPPYLLHADLKRNDIVPSSGFGNIWLVTALGFLTSFEQLLVGKRSASDLTLGVYPPLFQSFGYYGIYTFKFFKDGSPVYVVVDDTFPVNKSSLEPIFSRSSQPNCFWAVLLEKAYAKLHSSYASIQFGHPTQAITDLTGLTCTKTYLAELKSQDDIANLKRQVETQLKRGWFVACSASRLKRQVTSGIIEQSLYSVLSLVEIPDNFSDNVGQSFKLVCLRNSQANSEWRGQWSQHQARQLGKKSKLNKNMKLIQQFFKERNQQRKNSREDLLEEYTLKQGDGTFLMDIRDWLNVFDTLYTVVAERTTAKKMRTKEVWGPVMQGGMPKSEESMQNFYRVNFSYRLEVVNQAEIVIQLSQRDGRLFQGLQFPFSEATIPLALFVIRSDSGKLPQRYSKKDVVASCALDKRRSIALSFMAEKATYFVVPCTEQQPAEKPYPEFCLDILFQADAAKLPSVFHQAQPHSTKTDSTLKQLVSKLSDITKDQDRTFSFKK